MYCIPKPEIVVVSTSSNAIPSWAECDAVKAFIVGL
jgi:hypothetical protein